MTLVLAEVLQPLGLVTDAASKLNRLTPDTVAALGISRPAHASSAVEHRIAEFFQLPLRKRILHTDLLARLAFYSATIVSYPVVTLWC